MTLRHTAFLGLLAATACNGTDDTDDTDVTDTDVTACTVQPGAWSAPDWDTTAAEALALRASLDTLVAGTMQAAEGGTVEVDDVSDLQGPFEAGDPSLADVTTEAYAAITADAFQDFVDMVGAGEQTLIDDSYAWVETDHGGIWSGRALDEGGVEPRQIVDKGLFAGGAFYPYALSLTEGTITPATIDAIAAAYGANSALAGDDVTDSANYTHRMGMHADMVAALTAAKAYAADEACTAERDEALVTVFRTWERAMMARYVYYANAAYLTVSAPTAPDDLADAAHELAEGIGLGIGFYGMPHPTSGPLAGAGRLIGDADIEAAAEGFGVDLTDLGASTTGPLLVNPTGFEAGVTGLEAKVKQVYGLTDADIASFRSPTEG